MAAVTKPTVVLLSVVEVYVLTPTELCIDIAARNSTTVGCCTVSGYLMMQHLLEPL